jgi:hypothetical protein
VYAFFDLANRAAVFLISAIRNLSLRLTFINAHKAAQLFTGAPDLPASSTTPLQALTLSALGSTETTSRLLSITNHKTIKPIDLSKPAWINSDETVAKIELKLRQSFDRSGSDKGSHHRYSNLYAALLAEKISDPGLRILEVGMGTNRSSIPSNMGLRGKPGASLRVWAELSETVQVVGMDIDKTILFSEERISTCRVDQMDRSSWRDVPQFILDQKFDLIIDDGLHAPLANLNTIEATFKLLKPGGFIVIEDVPMRALSVWSILKELGFEGFEIRIYSFNHSNCVVFGAHQSFPPLLPE